MRTTRFGNGAEKVRKITVTKPDAMAARKKDKEENETLDDLQQNEVERGSIQPLLKANSEAAERCSSEPNFSESAPRRGPRATDLPKWLLTVSHWQSAR